jgi:release factor glutamine methyltransferase
VIREALRASVDALRAAGIEDPRLDAELLLAEATGWERARLVANPEAAIPPAATRRFAEMVRRRLRREPVAYILGRRGFRDLELVVDPRVLVPRPETELLVDFALELRPLSVLDVGTGSGALALAIAAELPDAEVTATDISAGALAVAAANAERLGLGARVELFEGTLPPRGEEFDLVVANLPYVSERDWGELQREVTAWEPREALLAGPDGLDVFRSAVPALAAVTDTLALEIGQGQAAAVGGLLRAAGFSAIESRPDLAGIERLVIGYREPAA